MPKTPETDVVMLLKEDHKKVKELFKQFEKADQSGKQTISDEVDAELRVHSKIEEEILYPAMREIESEMVAEAYQEHEVVEELLDELAAEELDDETFEAKFTVMQENVEHHIEEEEKEMLPKASKLPNYEDLSRQMWQRKTALMAEMGLGDMTHNMPGTKQNAGTSSPAGPSGGRRKSSGSGSRRSSSRTAAGGRSRAG
jgi:hypothetical protein